MRYHLSANINAILTIKHAQPGLGSDLVSRHCRSHHLVRSGGTRRAPAAITLRLHCISVSSNEMSSFVILGFSFVKVRYFLTAAVLTFGRAAFEGSIIGCASRLLFRTLNGSFAGQ